MTLANLITKIHCFLFYAILFTSDTITVRYEIFLLFGLTQKYLFFRQIKLMATPIKGMVPYTEKAGSLMLVSCDITGEKPRSHKWTGGKYRKWPMCACGMEQPKKAVYYLPTYQ